MRNNIKNGILKVKSIFFTASFIRYLIIGFSTFGLQAILLNISIQSFKFDPTFANAVSLAISMVYNFTLTNYWTFKAGHTQQKTKITKYLILAAFNYIFQVIAFAVLNGGLKINYNIVLVINTCLIVSWNFIIYKFWVFKVSEEKITVDYQDPTEDAS